MVISIITLAIHFVIKKFNNKELATTIDEFLDEPAYKRYLNHAEQNSQKEVQNKKSKNTEASLDEPSYLRVNIYEYSKRHHDWIASNK